MARPISSRWSHRSFWSSPSSFGDYEDGYCQCVSGPGARCGRSLLQATLQGALGARAPRAAPAHVARRDYSYLYKTEGRGRMAASMAPPKSALLLICTNCSCDVQQLPFVALSCSEPLLYR